MLFIDAYIDYFKQNYTNNNLEDILLELRKMGATQIETLRVLRSELSLSMSEADKIVLNSETWKDTKDTTIQARQAFEDFMDSLED